MCMSMFFLHRCVSLKQLHGTSGSIASTGPRNDSRASVVEHSWPPNTHTDGVPTACASTVAKPGDANDSAARDISPASTSNVSSPRCSSRSASMGLLTIHSIFGTKSATLTT